MNILITGGAGFIGSNLSLALLAKKHSVTVLDNLLPQIHGNNPETDSSLFKSINGKVNFIYGSVTSRDDWQKALVGQDIVVHFAAETGTGQSMYEVERYIEVNIKGTSIMLDLLANTKHSIKKVVVASSRAVYGEGKYYSQELGTVYPQSRQAEIMSAGMFEVTYPGSGPLKVMPTDENSLLQPHSVYGITKQTQEQLVMTVCKAIDVAGVAFRYQNVFGPGQSLINPYTGILSIFSNCILNGIPINIFEDGLESRDFVFIDDVVEATIRGIESQNANNEVFNVGFGAQITVLDVVTSLIREYGKSVEYSVTGKYRLGDIRHNFADITKLVKRLEFSPKIDFNTGIKRFADWVKGQPLSPNRYLQSLSEMETKKLLK